MATKNRWIPPLVAGVVFVLMAGYFGPVMGTIPFLAALYFFWLSVKWYREDNKDET